MESENVEKMHKLHESGMTAEEVGKIFGVHEVTVRRRLRAAGYHARNKSESKSGELHNSWRGGRIIDKSGYVHVRVSARKYVLEHRLAMEQFIGRPLTSTEVVHHVNGNVADNRIENLRLLGSNSEHMQEDHLRGKWSRNYDACIRCGTTDRKHAGNGVCVNCNMYLRSVRRRGEECRYDHAGKRIFSDDHRRKLSEASFRRYGRNAKKEEMSCRTEA